MWDQYSFWFINVWKFNSCFENIGSYYIWYKAYFIYIKSVVIFYMFYLLF